MTDSGGSAIRDSRPTTDGDGVTALSDLAQPDARTLHYSLLGLSAAALPAENVVESLKQDVARAVLHPDVPDEVQRSFERLRTLHVYGILCYDLFTVAEESSRLVFEQALRRRFLEYYRDGIPIVAPDGSEELFHAERFQDIYEAFRHGGERVRVGWRFRWNTIKDVPRMPLTLQPLLTWARSVHLLDGQRSRLVEKALVWFRHAVAHPDSYHLVGPHDSALAIRDLAEFINRLWGKYTEGGRLYPAPISREICVLGWLDSGQGRSWVILRSAQLEDHTPAEDWTYFIVRAVRDDGQLLYFDVRYEMTYFPSEFLWGPGGREAALAWLDAEKPSGDETSFIDRLFVVQVDEGKALMPMRPEVALSLPEAERKGVWHLIRADDPLDALVHVRRITGETPPTDEWSMALSVEPAAQGTWTHMQKLLDEMGIVAKPPPDVQLPGRWASSN